MNTTTIDLENLTSKAIRELDERREGLAQARDAFAERARADMGKLNKQQLVEEIAKTNSHARISVHSAKNILVDLAVDEITNRSEHSRALRRLELAAQADQRMAKTLNALIERAEKELALLTPERRDGEQPDLFDHAWALRDVDSFLTAAETARYAVKVARAINERGMDIREVSVKLAKDALRQAPSALKHIANNGLSGAGRARELYEGVAAEAFARTVGQTYAWISEDEDDLMVNLADLTF